MYQDDSFATGYAVGRDSNNGYGNGIFGGDWSWWIIILLIFGWGGFGNNGFGGGFGGGNNMAFDLGRLATTNDVASGFSTSEIMSDLNDIILGQAQLQNGINQGFAGLQNTITNGNANIISTVNSGFAGVNNAICTLGYNQAQLVNGLSRELSECCCSTKAAIADLKYANERQTCDLITNQNNNTRAILDYLTGEKIAGLQAENAGLKAQISNDRQSAYLLSELKECPKAAYIVPNPNCCYNYNVTGYGYNNGCGCGV